MAEAKQYVKELAQASSFASTDALLVENGDGTQLVKGSVLAPAITTIMLGDSAGSHNAIYRGKSLGTSFTSAQSAAIQAGTFDDLFIGDYWTINGVNWRVAHFDYWYNTGDTNCTTHHAVIVPDSNLSSAAMNSTNTTEGGYVGSEMYTTNLEDAKTAFKSAFGSAHILSHRELLTNAVTSGYPSAGAWCDSTIELMNEPMVYGSYIMAPGSTGSVTPYRYTNSKTQLALFAHNPERIGRRATWWLRDVVSSAYFAVVNANGSAAYYGASTAVGVRPAAAIY